jgi:hypothetical protein
LPCLRTFSGLPPAFAFPITVALFLGE